MTGAGLEVDPDLIRDGEYDEEVSAKVTHELLDLDQPPTAIFAANDNSAIAIMEVAASRDVRVPDQLSVVGFDNTPESALAQPALSTINQPIQEMGQRAVALLVQLLAGRAAGRHAHHARDPPGRPAVQHTSGRGR